MTRTSHIFGVILPQLFASTADRLLLIMLSALQNQASALASPCNL
jgi:hypothetical protein